MVISFFTIFSLLFACAAYAAPVVTSPIDSRPVSNDYLENLVSLNGDTLYTVPAENLDLFTSDVEKFADSELVRASVRENVKNHPNSDTTVIINASTYFTGGLIGSRCAQQYENTDEAVKELFSLISDYPKPKYYVNIAMPRNLPETRGQEIWPDNNKITGIGEFFLKYNPDYSDYDTVYEKYSLVTPQQFLMEYGYVYNKRLELGEDALTDWEKDYLEFAERQYVNNDTYSQYIKNYITPFEKTADICENLIRWQRVGRISELIIGNDDLQLPDSISYFFSNGENWVQLENGTPIKFSFSRTYMTSGENSVVNRMTKTYSKEETALALEGKSDNINFIFGMDEIPHLIYARSLAQRAGHSVNIEIINFKNNKVAADYDVITPSRLLEYDKNFVSAGLEPYGRKFRLFVFDYGVCSEDDLKNVMNEMSKASQQGETGLIELYTYGTLTGKNFLFNTLLENSANKTGSIGISDLSCFSAWNTNANAIGLGIANAQTYVISKKSTNNFKTFAENQMKILAQHIFDDGIYYGRIREYLTSEGYSPTHDDMTESPYLCSLFNSDLVSRAFEGKRFKIDGRTAGIFNLKLKNAYFPWGRLFDCATEISCDVKEIHGA